MEIIRDVETRLLGTFTTGQIEKVSDALVKALSGYDVTKACTDIVVYDDINERILKRYSACLYVDGMSEKTVKMYVYMCKKLADCIGKPYTEMTAYDIRYFLAKEKEKGSSGRTLENKRAYISAFFQWMTREDFIEKNPCEKIKPIKYTDEVKLPFTDVEMDAIRKVCYGYPKRRAIVEMLRASGVRVAELCAMKKSDIDFASLKVHVRHGKGDKERITYITALAKKYILAYLAERKDDSDILIANRFGKPMTTNGVRALLKSIEKESGVEDIHPHRFRRTFATDAATRGMDLQDIQRLMGHSNINTTMEYVYMTDAKVAANYKKYIA